MDFVLAAQLLLSMKTQQPLIGTHTKITAILFLQQTIEPENLIRIKDDMTANFEVT